MLIFCSLFIKRLLQRVLMNIRWRNEYGKGWSSEAHVCGTIGERSLRSRGWHLNFLSFKMTDITAVDWLFLVMATAQCTGSLTDQRLSPYFFVFVFKSLKLWDYHSHGSIVVLRNHYDLKRKGEWYKYTGWGVLRCIEVFQAVTYLNMFLKYHGVD